MFVKKFFVENKFSKKQKIRKAKENLIKKKKTSSKQLKIHTVKLW